MGDPGVVKCKQRGRVFLWRYLENQRNYPGWQLFADELGASFLLELVTKMQVAEWPASKNVNISLPTARILKIPNNMNGKAKWVAVESFRLSYPKGSVSSDHWSLSGESEYLSLALGEISLTKFSEALQVIANGEVEKCVGPNDDCIWLWGGSL